jgi:hypothetical protein
MPLFLILVLILSIDMWLDRPSLVVGILVPATALLLPLSRTIEPNLALIAIAMILVFGKLVIKAEWIGTIWVPVGSVVAALVLVGVPMIMTLRGDLERYTQSVPVQTRMARFITELPSGLAYTTPWWPIVLLVVVAALAIGPSRQLLASTWWSWVLLSIPLGFAAVFFSQARVSIPYFGRYAVFWWPLIAVVVGALARGILDVSQGHTSGTSVLYKRVVQVVGSAIIIFCFLGLGIALRDELVTVGRADWAAASAAIEQTSSNTTVVIYEHARPIGQYRPPFYGQSRYFDSSRSVRDAGRLMRNPTQIEGSQQVALLLNGASPEIPDFSRHEIDEYFTLYLPTAPLVGPAGAATALVALAASLPAQTGSHAALVAAMILATEGEVTEACQLVDSYSLLVGERGERTLKQIENAGEFGSWIDDCSATLDLSPQG